MSERAPVARRRSALRAATWGGLLAAGCATYVDAIDRGQRYYEDNQYERALALWRDLDRRGAELLPPERARFAYFRGMTDYRLGFREDARHWLAVARAHELETRGALQPAWLERLEGALADLERDDPRARAGAQDAVQTIEAPPDALPPDARSPERAPPPAGAPPQPAVPAARPAPSGAAPPVAPEGETPGATTPERR